MKRKKNVERKGERKKRGGEEERRTEKRDSPGPQLGGSNKPWVPHIKGQLAAKKKQPKL